MPVGLEEAARYRQRPRMRPGTAVFARAGRREGPSPSPPYRRRQRPGYAKRDNWRRDGRRLHIRDSPRAFRAVSGACGLFGAGTIIDIRSQPPSLPCRRSSRSPDTRETRRYRTSSTPGPHGVSLEATTPNGSHRRRPGVIIHPWWTRVHSGLNTCAFASLTVGPVTSPNRTSTLVHAPVETIQFHTRLRGSVDRFDELSRAPRASPSVNLRDAAPHTPGFGRAPIPLVNSLAPRIGWRLRIRIREPRRLSSMVLASTSRSSYLAFGISHTLADSPSDAERQLLRAQFAWSMVRGRVRSPCRVAATGEG